MLISRECGLRIKIGGGGKAQINLKIFLILKASGADLAFCLFIFLGQENMYLFKNLCG